MNVSSKTGLLASPTKKLRKTPQKNVIQLKAIAKPAPFVLKPYAGLFNPYPYGCSLLCNHPTDTEAKELLKKAKDSWAVEGRNVLLAEEIDAIKAELGHLHSQQKNVNLPTVESVPEELFRRYTETDSRPLTPAPTLASAATRASGSRRCVTPDPVPTTQIREKTLLILDLRRSHSQETLSCYGSSILEPPLIKVQHVLTRPASLEELTTDTKSLSAPFVAGRPKSALKNTETEKAETVTEEQEDEEDFIKRRGKRRRKKGRDSSRGPPAFQVSLDPETQVATIGDESRNTSARPSLISGQVEEMVAPIKSAKPVLRPSKSLDIDSFLDTEILRELRRELNEDIVENELNDKRRIALREALKTVSKDRIICEELSELQKELKVPPVNADLWISLPRTFTRSSARFELPMSDDSLTGMTPLDYVKNHIYVSNGRKLLYKCVFSRFRSDYDLENEQERKISGKVIQEALDLMMGKPMTQPQAHYIKNLIKFNDRDNFDFKTFCGISALCERVLAPEYCCQLPDRKEDPCHEVKHI